MQKIAVVVVTVVIVVVFVNIIVIYIVKSSDDSLWRIVYFIATLDKKLTTTIDTAYFVIIL